MSSLIGSAHSTPDLRIVAFSDVHGNIHGLRAVLERVKSQGADLLLCAGDLLGGGGGHQDVIDLLDEHQVVLIRGNHDEDGPDFSAVHDQIPEKHREWAAATHEWLTSRLDLGSLERLASLPMTHVVDAGGGHTLFACHATPSDNRLWANGPDVGAKTLIDRFAGLPHEAIIYGHYHQHHVQVVAGKMLANVASVGFRFDGLAAFSVIDFVNGRWMIEQHHAAYDPVAERRLIEERRAPLPRYELLQYPRFARERVELPSAQPE